MQMHINSGEYKTHPELSEDAGQYNKAPPIIKGSPSVRRRDEELRFPCKFEKLVRPSSDRPIPYQTAHCTRYTGEHHALSHTTVSTRCITVTTCMWYPWCSSIQEAIKGAHRARRGLQRALLLLSTMNKQVVCRQSLAKILSIWARWSAAAVISR